MSTNKAVERVFDAAMKSMQDQPIAQDHDRMAGLQEYLELLELDAINGYDWISVFRGVFKGLCAVNLVGIEVVDDVDKALLDDGFIR